MPPRISASFPAQPEPDRAVAAQFSGTGQHQVAQPGQPGQGLALAAGGHGHARDFRQAAGDQRGRRVGAQSEAGADARGDRDDILQRCAKLHAYRVAVGVQPQRGP